MSEFADSIRLVIANTAMNAFLKVLEFSKDFIIDKQEMSEESTAEYSEIISYLMNKCTQYKLTGQGDIRYRNWEFGEGYKQVSLERLNDKSIFIYKKIPLLVEKTRDQSTKKETITISYVRKTLDFKDLVRDSSRYYKYLENLWTSNYKRFDISFMTGEIQEHKNSPDREVTITKPRTKYDDFTGRPIDFTWEQIRTSPIIKVNNLFIADYLKENMKDVEFWSISEDWYKNKGLSWRRGWLLHGSPGNGKSSIVYKMAVDLDLPIFIFDIASMSNKDFKEKWRYCSQFSPSIVLIEDIDAVFNKRKNIKDSKFGLSFDCLLNTLAGVGQNNGIFLIITTNDISKIDPALGISAGNDRSTRPGRIDRVIEVLPPCKEAKRFVADLILSDYPEIANKFIKDSLEGESYAQFKDKCEREALKKHWENVDGTAKD